ncbi:type I restriction-modification system subunit M [Spirosoma montaniterrae]|uniref:site-specific DNA-methyltransferase (adenine-specific) n=1 Tax=Spirosoma montaniterrae TaxID=1178516 RepID=A0A1P9WZ02_9BACT|nr:class I SAM-dependent DNA methyltransferase [Spirosoma montaniterrae]AQG80593.1 DNA methyltransferase [Spirosoma montaniterrae]
MLQNPTIKRLINQLWDKFWSGGISNPLTAIEQITYLLFMRMLDAQDAKKVADAEFTGDTYLSIFAGSYLPAGQKDEPENYVSKQMLRWSYFKNLPAAEMLSQVQLNVFPFLKTLNASGTPFARHMDNAVFIIPKPSLMVEAVKLIDDIFKEVERDATEGGHTLQDIQGDVYEHLLSEIATAGKNGQFRTPRHIINLIVELLRPELGKRIADPACGSAGFLLAAYVYILTQHTSEAHKKTDEDGFVRGTMGDLLTNRELRADWERDCFHGYDIDQTMVRMGLMNLMMHGFQNPQLDYQDTLSKGYDEAGLYDYVLANPPFTGNIDKGDVNTSLKLPTTKTELLFLERIYQMLRIGGTAAVIVPQGVLFGAGRAFVEIRKQLVEQAELKAVITMPSGVFKPYAGVSTAILIFTKGEPAEQIWFYEMKNDGRTLDDKRTKLSGYGDLQNIVTRYHSRDPKQPNDRKSQCFFVEKQELADNNYDLSLSKYKEEDYEATTYDAPADILKKLRTLEADILQGIDELEGYLV